MAKFEPSGVQARWRTIYDMLRGRAVGDTLTYADMAEALELDADADRHAIQMAMRRAAKEFETADKHAVESVATVGYRIVEAPEHLDLAKKQQRRAGKALQRGHSKVVNVDLSNVEPEVRSAFQVVAHAFSMQMDMNRRLTGRQDRLEQVVEQIEGRSERSEAEVAELRARLERLEATLPTVSDDDA